MSASNANVFTGPTGTLPVVNTQGNIYEEVQVAAAGQTVFNLATFQYTPGTKTIIVLKNGVELRRAVSYTETSNTRVTLAAGAALNDTLTFRAYAIGTLTAPLQNNGVIPAGTAGQVLAKVDASDYSLQWKDLSSIATLLDQPVQAVASAPTVDVTPYAATTRNLLITGTTQIDGWAITAGQVFLVKFAASLQLSNNVNQVTPTGAAVKVGPNDSCLVRATANNIVEILSFSKSTAVVPPYYNDHRLTLTSAAPVTTADVIGASTLYLTAYRGNNISLFNGTAWVVRQFAEISIALAGLVVGRAYDVFCYDNAGTPTLELFSWVSSLVRATALVRQDGVLVKSGDATRKYIGTILTTAANTTEDSQANRYVWNMYNRVARSMLKFGNAGSWNLVGPSAIRQANASALNQLSVIVGLVEDPLDVSVSTAAIGSGSGLYYIGIGINGAVFSVNRFGGASTAGQLPTTCNGKLIPVLGLNNLVWLEQVAGAITVTFYGSGDGYILGTVQA
jgi:hypothetical protein